MERIAARSEIPQRFQTAFASDAPAMRLGSIFVDLPYLDHFPLQVARHYTRGVTFTSEWGQIFHTRGTGSFALKLIEALRRAHGLGRDSETRALAFIGGFLSHHALDRTIHPLVRQHVDKDLDAHGGNSDQWHSHCEAQQSLYWHLRHVGYDVMGTPYFDERGRGILGARLAAPGLPIDLWKLIQSACLDLHARAPQRANVHAWLRWARLYGRLLASPLGRREGIHPDDSQEPERRRIYYDEPVFDSWVDRAIANTLQGLQAAATLLGDVIDGNARRKFLETVPDVDISVGS